MTLVRVDYLPNHVAVIMDGNGRWAGLRGKHRTFGHREGSKAVRRVVRASRRMGIQTLTLYAFGEQNWERPSREVDALMRLFNEFLLSERAEVLRTGIRFRAIGRLHRLPRSLLKIVHQLEQDTAHLTGMTLQLAVSYGGQEEITDAARNLARRAVNGEIDPDSIDKEMLVSELASMDSGPVDLLIRTGGEYRISNFLLWGAAFAELYFSKTLWPDFGEAELFEAIRSFQQRERRYGRVRSNKNTIDDQPVEKLVTSAHA